MVAVLCVGCAPSEPRLGQLASPVGSGEYGRILRERAEVELTPAELAEAAARDAEWIERRLDRLAHRIAPGTPWRTLFEALRAEHPPDGEAVLESYRREVERARRFVVDRGLMSLPEARFEVIATSELPVPERYPLTAYLGHRLAVATRSADGVPRLADHCRVCVPPLAIHEAFPGHHAAFLRQRAAGPETDPEVEALLGAHFKNRFFHEGWAQYAEVLMLEQGLYDGSPERELGAWRNLLLRVVRARVDPLLHTGVLTPEEAAETLARELLLTPELAREEVRRHLEDPGLKAAYYVGLVQVLALRRALEDERPGLSLRAFHDRFVERALPVPAAARLRFGIDLPPWPTDGLQEVLPLGIIEP